MAREQRAAVLRDVGTLYQVGTVAGHSDAQLLESFTTRRDESAELAFRALVERHGPMVLRVCRAVLRDSNDAQDAFQATFLVLVRKARTIRHRDSVGSWLHGVALRVASCSRSIAARRRKHERRAAERSGSRSQTAEPRDWDTLLQEEIGRLPESFRAAIVLCDLMGLSHEQAARQLGCPVGTIKSRQSRARDRLRTRLTRRGLAPMVGAPGDSLVRGWTPAPADLPAGLADSTVRAAVQAAAGKAVAAGSVSASVAALIEGTLTTMLATKLKIAALLILSMGLVAAGAGVLVGQERTTQTTKDATQPAAKTLDTAAKQDEESNRRDREQELRQREQELRKRIVLAARQRLEAQRKFYEEGRITIDRFLDASQQLMAAEIQASETTEERVAAAKAHLERVRKIFERESDELKTGRGTVADMAEAQQRLEQAALDYLTASNPDGPLAIDALARRLRVVEGKLDKVLQNLEDLKRARSPSLESSKPPQP